MVSNGIVFGTLAVILSIFAVLSVAAHRAEKILAEKAAAKRLEMPKSGSKAKKN